MIRKLSTRRLALAVMLFSLGLLSSRCSALREKARGYVEDFRSLSARTGERPNS